jgi:hypothetical protein
MMKKRSASTKAINVSAFVMIACVFSYFGGYPLGRFYYGTIASKKSSGYQTWRVMYRPMIFRSINQDLYSYSQVDSEFWIDADLDSIDRSVWCKDGLMLCNFTRSDGRNFKAFVRWVLDYDLIPRIGGKYELKVKLTMQDSPGLNWWTGSSADESLSWNLSDTVVDAREK